MIAGVQYYEIRAANDNPVLVKHKETGEVGAVVRVTPAGNSCPAQAYVTYDTHERWELVSNLVRVS